MCLQLIFFAVAKANCRNQTYTHKISQMRDSIRFWWITWRCTTWHKLNNRFLLFFFFLLTEYWRTLPFYRSQAHSHTRLRVMERKTNLASSETRRAEISSETPETNLHRNVVQRQKINSIYADGEARISSYLPCSMYRCLISAWLFQWNSGNYYFRGIYTFLDIVVAAVPSPMLFLQWIIRGCLNDASAEERCKKTGCELYQKTCLHLPVVHPCTLFKTWSMPLISINANQFATRW